MKGYDRQQGLVRSVPTAPPSLWRRALRQLRRWRELALQRRQLAQLDGAILKDLGLSRADAIAESDRPFWDDPQAAPTPRREPKAGSRASSLLREGWRV